MAKRPYQEKFRYEVDVNEEQVEEALQLLRDVNGNAKLALLRGINKAGGKIRTMVSSRIRDNVRLSAQYITGTKNSPTGKPRLQFIKASFAKLEGRISTPVRGISLARYSLDKQISGDGVMYLKPPPIPEEGIVAQIKTKGKAVQYSNEWFYMVLKGSRRIGIVRWKSEARQEWSDLEVAVAPSLSQVFKQIKDGKIDPTAQRYFREEVLAQVDYLVQQRIT